MNNYHAISRRLSLFLSYDMGKKYYPDRVNYLGDRLQKAADMEMKEIIEAFETFKKK